MKSHKKQLSAISSDLLNQINQILQNSNDDTLKNIEISGLKFSEATRLNKQYWCCRIINGEIVCKWQDKPC